MSCRPDHPHAGGEYGSFGNGTPLKAGPSPRGWGIRCTIRYLTMRSRTIPTRVGNTSTVSRSISAFADHPHAGGEYPAALVTPLNGFGPSPRGWGIQSQRNGQSPQSRTIPTRVGNTWGQAARRTKSSDHPHAGGEYNGVQESRIAQLGPSPRGWGIRHQKMRRGMPRRTIPTRVGNTYQARESRS